MRTTIASTLILIAVCLAIFAAKPANLDTKARSVDARRRDSLPTLGDPRSPIRHLIVVVGEKKILELPSKFTPLEESNPFAEDHKHRKATKHRQTSLLIIAIELKIYYNQVLTDS